MVFKLILITNCKQCHNKNLTIASNTILYHHRASEKAGSFLLPKRSSHSHQQTGGPVHQTYKPLKKQSRTVSRQK